MVGGCLYVCWKEGMLAWGPTPSLKVTCLTLSAVWVLYQVVVVVSGVVDVIINCFSGTDDIVCSNLCRLSIRRLAIKSRASER